MTRRPHLLEVGLEWPPETFLVWKLEALAAWGVRVSVGSYVDRRQARAVALRGVELVRIPRYHERLVSQLLGVAWWSFVLLVRRPGRLATLVRSVAHGPRREPRAMLRRLRRYTRLAALDPDVVHFEWESAAVANLDLADAWRKPIVVSCHGSGLNVHPHTGRPAPQRYEALFSRASAVVCVSEALVEKARAAGAGAAKIRLIRPAVDPGVFRPGDREPHPGPLRAVSIGALVWVKGHEYAIEAIRLARDAGIDVRLDILGGGPADESGEHSDLDRLMFAIHDLRLEPYVTLHGQVGSDAVLERLRASDVLVQASVSEGIPTAVLEAMACELPVVVTDCGGVREAVEDGTEGFVVPKRRPAELAAALGRLAGDPALRARMGTAGRARVVAEFALADQVERFARLYEELAELRPRRAGVAYPQRAR